MIIKEKSKESLPLNYNPSSFERASKQLEEMDDQAKQQHQEEVPTNRIFSYQISFNKERNEPPMKNISPYV